MSDLASGENKFLTCGQENQGLFSFSAGTKGLFLWIDWERLEQCINDIEAVRKMMMYLCRFWCHSGFTVVLRYTENNNNAWSINTDLRESGMMSSLLFYLYFWSWFHRWLWLVWLPASSEVLTSATAASLHVSDNYNIQKFSSTLFSFFLILLLNFCPLRGTPLLLHFLKS